METFVQVMRKVWQRTTRSGTSTIGLLQTLWIDVDSSVKTVCGQQQGTVKGYNPHNKGARSYHPQLAFCTQTKEILQAWMGAMQFLAQRTELECQSSSCRRQTTAGSDPITATVPF